jgi:hypothetical protein
MESTAVASLNEKGWTHPSTESCSRTAGDSAIACPRLQ